MKKVNDSTGFQDWISNLTPEETREFLRKVMGPPKKTLEGKERDHLLLLLNLIEPYSSSNNQHSWTDQYKIGLDEYHVTWFSGEDVIVEKILSYDESDNTWFDKPWDYF